MTPDSEAMDTQNQNPEGFRSGAVAAGVILLIAGTGMFVGIRNGLDIRLGRLIGPMVLIVLGASMVLERSAFVVGHRTGIVDGERRARRRRRRGASSGIWLIGIGVWMAVAQNHLFGLDYHNSWPLFIVLSGIIMVIRGFK